jgi:hypothetical protein
MTTARWAERGLWIGAMLAAAAGVIQAQLGTKRALAAARPTLLPAIPAAPPRAIPDSLESAVEVIANLNLFRPERTSAEQHSSAQPTTAMTMPQPPSAKPHLVLRGVLGGPPWDAIIEGIPGREGSAVLRAGQSLGGVTVRAVRQDTAWARGFDTTWTLTLGRSWQ